LQLHALPHLAEMPAGAPARPLVLPRAELLAALGVLRTLCREYRELHAHIWEDDAPGGQARALLARHRALAAGEGAPFAALGAAGALLDFMVDRLHTQRLVFHLPRAAAARPQGDGEAMLALAERLGELQGPLEALASRVFALAQSAPGLGGPRAQRVLYPVAALFKAILRQDWADAELVLNHLNMVTTSRDNHALVEQIGRLVRSIYNSLNEISASVPIAALTNVSEEIPDAVQKLGSVIAELEDGANRNLDLLEALTGQVQTARQTLEDARQALAGCEAELAALARSEPAAAPALEALRAELQHDAAQRLEAFGESLQQCHDRYMTLFANQSYQDLTGQTLKKVIAFIEGLQYQLIQVISKGSGRSTVAEPAASHDAAIQAGPDAHNRLSQERVDSMLAELGF
jgi:chemotaxis protein CheZ